MPTSKDILALAREDLYELVWSKPMTELAKDLGLSDVALAKRCRKLGVPVPGRGYWARVAAGQKPHRPKLKKRKESLADYNALTFAAPSDEPETPAAPEPKDVAAIRASIQALEIPTEIKLRPASAPVKRTAVQIRRPWRREILWNRGEKRGPIVTIDVDDEAIDRALTVADLLIQCADSLGWPFADQPTKADPYSHQRNDMRMRTTPKPGCLLVAGEAITFRIHERRRRIEHPLSSEEKARIRRGETFYHRDWTYEPTGELRLTITEVDNRHRTHTFSESKRRPLERKVPQILDRLLDEALRMKSDREARRLAEIERRKQEEIRWALSRRREANASLIDELEAQAGAWLRARFLRSYVRALKRATEGVKLASNLGEKSIDFVEWADHYIDQLDPLSPTPHDEDLKADRSSYYSPTDTKVQETLSRLLGQHWDRAFKVGQDTETADSSSGADN